MPRNTYETGMLPAEVELEVPYSYTVRSVSARGAESEPTPPASASAVDIREPVFSAVLQREPVGMAYGGPTLSARVHGPAHCGGTLNLQQGGYLAFPHHPHFELGQPISVECWVWFREAGQMPVIVSCGLWRQAGWFLQRIGQGFRWHVGGIDCDGGRMALGKWIHLVGTYDGRTLRLFQDGVLVAETPGKALATVWPGELLLGQYSGGPSPEYQVVGRIAGVKLYHRALEAAEAAESAAAPPAVP